MERVIVLVAGAVTAGLLLSGCATAPDPADPAVARAVLEQTNEHNAQDVAFVRDMIPHHVQGKALTDLVQRRSTDPGLRDLAALMDRQGGAEIGQLRGTLAIWGTPSDESVTPGMATMMGMATPATLATLGTRSGAAFDRLWLETMIRHHEGAVAMARAELAGGTALGAHNIAVSTVAVQQQQIDQMRVMLARTT